MWGSVRALRHPDGAPGLPVLHQQADQTSGLEEQTPALPTRQQDTQVVQCHWKHLIVDWTSASQWATLLEETTDPLLHVAAFSAQQSGFVFMKS